MQENRCLLITYAVLVFAFIVCTAAVPVLITATNAVQEVKVGNSIKYCVQYRFGKKLLLICNSCNFRYICYTTERGGLSFARF